MEVFFEDTRPWIRLLAVVGAILYPSTQLLLGHGLHWVFALVFFSGGFLLGDANAVWRESRKATILKKGKS